YLPLPLLNAGAALVHVQVGAADIGRGDLDERVVRSLETRIGNLADPDRPWPFVDQSFHGRAPLGVRRSNAVSAIRLTGSATKMLIGPAYRGLAGFRLF